MGTRSDEPGWLARQPAAAQWGGLLLCSAAVAAILEVAGVPAALLMGPMAAGVLFSANGATIRMLRPPALGAQAIVGCLMARAITADIVVSFLKDWPLFVGVVMAVILASTATGWLMTRWRILPGTTAVWGTSPGAATAMMVVSEAYGADSRLVAFMQYLRVLCVAVAASIVGRLWTDGSAAAMHAVVWFPAVDVRALAETLALAAVGAVLGRLSRLPAGNFMVPMVLGSVLHASGLVRIELPEWLLAVTYAVLGWNTGLSFTRALLGHAWRALPAILLSIGALIGFCAALAYLLTRTLGIDPLTAWLATSPGSMDSVAIIAAASRQVDLPFVMALQTARFMLVILIGPALARFVARRTMR
jgi:hypothetical protein